MPTIKPSIGTSTANCYVTEASANSYFEIHYNSQAWTNLLGNTNATASSNLKQAVLIQATREIDRTFRFFGGKYNTGQRGQTNYQTLEFPRGADYDANGDLYIQDDIKFGTYEQALWILMRTKQRRSETDTVDSRSIIGKDAYNYIDGFVNRQVVPRGSYIWQ